MLRLVGRTAAIAALAALIVVGCSDDDSGSSTTVRRTSTLVDDAPVATAVGGTSPSDRIGCEVEVSGDIEASFTGKDNDQAFASDHYFSQDEIDALLGIPQPATVESTVAGEEPDLTIPPRAEGTAQVAAWFLLNCQGGDITFSVFSNPNSTGDDVPRAPATYVVAPAGFETDPRHFGAFIVFGTEPEPSVWNVGADASIDIDRFDERGAAGSFEVPMIEQRANPTEIGRSIVVKGTFDVTCKEGANCAT